MSTEGWRASFVIGSIVGGFITNPIDTRDLIASGRLAIRDCPEQHKRQFCVVLNNVGWKVVGDMTSHSRSISYNIMGPALRAAYIVPL
jgi:hypothetical protein